MATIRYIVHDVEAALPFYRDLLGFTVVELHGPAVAILEKDGLQLWVSGPPSSGARAMPDGRKPEPGGWNRMVIVVDDLEALVAKLKSAGVTFRNDIISGPGGKQTLAEDPSGNAVELFQPA